MTDVERLRHAEARMTSAKSAFTRAAMAALQGLPLAEAQARDALEELALARAELRSLDA